jgi:hypothetical protein
MTKAIECENYFIRNMIGKPVYIHDLDGVMETQDAIVLEELHHVRIPDGVEDDDFENWEFYSVIFVDRDVDLPARFELNSQKLLFESLHQSMMP